MIKECAEMKSVLVSVVAVGACLVIFSPSVVSAAGNPSGTGPPSQTCQNEVLPSGALATPGHSANSPGSVFNEPGFGSVSGGTGGNAYNAAGAPSQYDVACFQQFQHSQVP